MKLQIKKILKPVLFTFLSAVLSFSFIFGGYKIFYAEAVDNFENTSIFSVAKDSYHNQMNAYFNDKFDQLTEIFEKDGLGINDKRLDTPDCQKTKTSFDCADECPEGNLSAFCVGMNALDVYRRYSIALENVKDGDVPVTISDLNTLVPFMTSINSDIDAEIPEAKKILEGTVGVYNEYIMSYPMHKKYEEIIKSLIKYKTKLKTLKNEVKQFPGNFVDATSTKCL